MRIDEGNLATPSSIITFPLRGSQKEKRGKRRHALEANALEEIIAENCLNLGKETNIQIQDSQRTLIKINKCRSTPRHIAIKLKKYNR